jgi:hypothetical protein
LQQYLTGVVMLTVASAVHDVEAVVAVERWPL